MLEILDRLRPVRGKSPAHLTAQAGLDLVGTPYVAGTLAAPGPERLVCDLRGLDCVTFVESALAIALTLCRTEDSAAPEIARQTFEAELAALRYRTGRPEGYASRLHYFSDWIRHNEARGVVREITRELGGEPDTRPIDYMTAHAELYPPLADPGTFEATAAVERDLSRTIRWVLPASRESQEAGRIDEGDILALVPRTAGLDVSHTGLAHRTPDGVLHLLHASEQGGRVQVTEGSLADYLGHHPKIVGIRVIRPSGSG